MVWNEVRLSGDPFDSGELGGSLRACLHAARRRGFRVGIALNLARGDREHGGRKVTLGDGTGHFSVWTKISEAELALCLEAVARPVAETAPLLTFGGDDARLQAQLEWPLACCALDASTGDALRTIEKLEASLQGKASRTDGWRESELDPFLALAPTSSGSTIVHFGSSDPAEGTDKLVIAHAHGALRHDCELLIAMEVRDPDFEARMLAVSRQSAAPGVLPRVTFHCGGMHPDLLRDVAMVVFPVRELRDATTLVYALASGRPVVVSRFAATAAICGSAGIVLAVGGRLDDRDRFEPDLRSLEWAMGQVFAHRLSAVEMAARARAHVLTHLRRGAPAATPLQAPSGRPLVVLETPLFARSSTSVLSLATAKALQSRNKVDVTIVPTHPVNGSLADLRRELPELVPLLSGRPPHADLWVASGWPPRQMRPVATTVAVRFDWEYGALPTDLTPLITSGADRVIVHSSTVRRTVASAGRSLTTIDLVPHGVDGRIYHDEVTPLREVLEWKGRRKALLFVGGLIWRKGFDVLLKVLAERHRGDDSLCLVVKSVGADSSYRGFELGELLGRYSRAPGAVATLHIERDLAPSEQAGLYRACDLLVHPYRGEGFGLPVLEARACGLPVLVTAGGATDDLQLDPDSDCSFIGVPSVRRTVDLPIPCEGVPFVREPSPQALAALLAECLLRLPELSAQARAVSAAVRNRFTWDAAAAALEALAFAAAGRRTQVGTGRIPLTSSSAP